MQLFKPKLKKAAAALMLAVFCGAPMAQAANHREAPITSIDRLADITDWFAFVSYDGQNADKVTMILNVDPLLDPGNGPNYFPFDPDILYEFKIDYDNDAVEDIIFQVRFTTEVRAPGLFTGFAGVGTGLSTPANSPAPVPAGSPLVPAAITTLDGPGSEGFSLRQKYTVTMLKRAKPGSKKFIKTDLSAGKTLIAVPTNVGPRTMPDYNALFQQGKFDLGNGIRVFAGTVEDPFYIDLGAAFDTLNLRAGAFASGIPGVLTDAEDADDAHNKAADNISGYNVNSIAIEVPIALLTRTGTQVPATDVAATIGTYGTTSRPRTLVRRSVSIKDAVDRDFLKASNNVKDFRQVQRMGNPLINELIIGTGSKDKFSLSDPKDDKQFASFFLDPALPRILNAIYTTNLPVPDAPRTDLLPLVTYAAPIAAAGTPAGPVADLLRLNTGVAPTPIGQQKRLGLLAHNAAGVSTPDLACYPNGRRPFDDVTDISLRAVAGVLGTDTRFTGFPHNRLGDGVNTNDVLPNPSAFPYLNPAHDGRNSRHVDPGEPGGGPTN